MKLLALETSAHVASVAIVDETGLIGELTLHTEMTHSQKLMPAIESLMAQLDLKIADMDGIAVASGPGSFTGIRIGVATAKGLAHGSGLKVIPVSTLEALAWNLAGCPVRVCPIMDARRDQVYTALFDCNAETPNRIWEDQALSVSELSERLRADGIPVWFVGDGVKPHQKTLVEAMGPLARFPGPHLQLQSASALGMAALGGSPESKMVTYSEAIPYYLRKAQAERTYDERNQQR